MFDLFSSSHLLILLVVLLVVVGPKDLPRLMHMVGQWAGKARRMANEFKHSFDEMARQEELDKLRLELEELRSTNLGVAEAAQKMVDADLPTPDLTPDMSADVAPEPRSGEFQINDAPRGGEIQVTETAKESLPASGAETPPQ